MRKLLILGAGGYGKVVADVARQLGCYEEIAFLDDGQTGSGILGKCTEFLLFCNENTEVYPAFGNNTTRMKWLERLQQEGIAVPSFVHPKAYVSPTAKIEAGTMVMPLAAVNTGCRVGKGCIVNLGALLDHDCVMEAGSHLAPGAIVKAENRIAAGMKIESGEVVENRTYPL